MEKVSIGYKRKLVKMESIWSGRVKSKFVCKLLQAISQGVFSGCHKLGLFLSDLLQYLSA